MIFKSLIESLPFLIFFCEFERVVGSSGESVCVVAGNKTPPEMICTREVLETRTQYDDNSINVGVTQRIDGSESEKQAVRDVLKHMDHYFFHEVLGG